MTTVLSFDSGAERMGWAIVGRNGQNPVYYHSGILELPGKGKTYQEYRIRLVEEVSHSSGLLVDLLLATDPDGYVVNEIVPAVGGPGFMASGQSYLANTAVTVAQTVAILRGVRVEQIAANTMQSRIAIYRNGKKIKDKKRPVRNGVIQLLPELEARKSDWTKHFDEPDAIGVGLAELGFSNV